MATFWLLCEVFLNILLYVSANTGTVPSLEVVTTDEFGKTCTTSLSSCSLKFKDGAISLTEGEKGLQGEKGDRGPPGEKGQKGMQGMQGSPGLTGPAGANGFPGQMGPTGEQGLRGETGSKGDQGRDGNPGVKGDIGRPGFPGVPGERGFDGPKGDRGLQGNPGVAGPEGKTGVPGIRGPPGPPGPQGQHGTMGSCPCVSPEVATSNAEINAGESKEPIGSINKPSQVVCKDMETETEDDEYYYMGPGKIKVNCKSEDDKKLTCIPQKDKYINTLNYTSEKEPYWLSSKGLTVEQLYNLTPAQIAWIQDKSNSASQRIKYHCINSVPYRESDIDHSTLLLSWNDVKFGPTTSEATPFVYTFESDGCANGGSSSIIAINSDSAQRLPVVDFLIRDTRKTHSVSVEHLELCFY